MNPQTPSNRIKLPLGCAALLLLSYAATVNEAAAASPLGKAAGKYKVGFKGTAKLGGFELPINAKGTMKLPRGKGTARLRLNVNDVPVEFPAKIKTAKVVQGGKKVKYQGTSIIPDNVLGLGRMKGPFSGRRHSWEKNQPGCPHHSEVQYRLHLIRPAERKEVNLRASGDSLPSTASLLAGDRGSP